MTVNELWNKYIDLYPEYKEMDYGVFEYSNDDIQNILNKVKNQEISAYDLLVGDGLPFVGDVNIISNESGDGIAVIKNIKVDIKPFNEITDYSKVISSKQEYEASLKEDLKEVNKEFNSNSVCVIETFDIVCR